MPFLWFYVTVFHGSLRYNLKPATMKKILFLLIVSLSGILSAQPRKITGTVTDSSSQPLPGCNITVKGTTHGTQTDFDGKYEIMASEGDVLVFSYVGMKTAEVKVAKQIVISVSLTEDAMCLSEVVTVGYGYSYRRGPTEGQLKRQEERQARNKAKQQIKSQLSGSVKGVSENKFGQQKNMASLLYIIDGVPINKAFNSLASNIPSEEIKKINTYKPAEAKKMFGNSAKNGCIVISTEKGNYRVQNDESYAEITENKFESTKLSALSTFSIDVDKASYSNIRRMINNGEKIPVDAVKVEEIINYFNYSYPQPSGEHPFSINTEVSKTPWNQETKLVRIGLQGKSYENTELPPSSLTFLIDVSGSMSSPNKLPLLKSAFNLLVNQLRPKDKVSIVVYAGAAGLVLKPTSGDDKETIKQAINNLEAGGSTAGGAGINLAYKLAAENFIKNGNNRVILATDGDFNVGASSDKEMQELIEEKRKSGVFLSVLGFGMGNYKDSKLETLADKGNGNHAYIDTMQEAQKVFGEEFGGTLFTIAKDVKIQIEVNPAKVAAYRLIGYENRLLADEEFIDDTKDAGELVSGHTVTALYEVIPVDSQSKWLKNMPALKYSGAEPLISQSAELFTVKFRYKKPNANNSIEMVHVQNDLETPMSADFKFASAAAWFAMQLRKSKFVDKSKTGQIISLAEEGLANDESGYRSEFIKLMKSVERL